MQHEQSNYQVRNKGKESKAKNPALTDYLTQASLFKEEPDDENNFAKSFAHI